MGKLIHLKLNKAILYNSILHWPLMREKALYYNMLYCTKYQVQYGIRIYIYIYPVLV